MKERDKKPKQIAATAYVRMSTEHQSCSGGNQMDVIREFAKRRGVQIVKRYSDGDRS
jgi:DNA invertase Pin-like site-specific DNA recombinase